MILHGRKCLDFWYCWVILPVIKVKHRVQELFSKVRVKGQLCYIALIREYNKRIRNEASL